MDWEVIGKLKNKKTKDVSDEIISVILANRGIKKPSAVKEFINPPHPSIYSLKELGIDSTEVKKAIKRLKEAKENDEHVIVYGDYDADGICATAIAWETLFKLGFKALPYIPERFSEGYGLNPKSLANLKEKDPKLGVIITVDNGIVALSAVKEAKKLGIDVIVTDHHLKGKVKNNAFSVIHTSILGGAALSLIFSWEVEKAFKGKIEAKPDNGLELAAIGTISDQIPLTGPNRSIVKYGLEKLNSTERLGLLHLMKQAQIENAGVYEVGYLIAPRLNAMGRLASAIDSLRLICTKDFEKAKKLSELLGKTNRQRQDVVDQVIKHAKAQAEKLSKDYVIVLANKDYHEGVIGLAAGKITEEFYRPTIVFCIKGDIAKASARSIAGFNIISEIRKLDEYLLEGGGHPMAAGFSIYTKDIKVFSEKINEIAKKVLTKEILTRKHKVDLQIDFKMIDKKLVEKIKALEPFGIGNPKPSFLTEEVKVSEVKVVGRDAKHLKLKLENSNIKLDAIAFGMAAKQSGLQENNEYTVSYQIEENNWNNNVTVQIKLNSINNI